MADNNHSPNWLKSLGPWVFLLLAVGLFLYSAEFTNQQKHQSEANPKQDIAIPNKDAIVNKHLQDVNKKILLQKEQARVNALKALPQNRSDVMPKPQWRRVEGVQQNLDRNELNAIRDLDRERELIDSPDAVVQSDIVEAEKNKVLEKAWREEYIRQYKKNAQEAGYEIEVDDNLNITSIKKRRAESGR